MKNDTLTRFSLGGTVALITGGAGFLGKRHAEALLDGGGKVVLIDISKQTLDSCVKELTKQYGEDKVFGYICDITKEKEVEKTVGNIEEEVGPIGILINNAANNPKVEKTGSKNFFRLENFPASIWESDLAVGLTGAFLMAKYAGAVMAKRKKGSIVNISSELGIVAPDQRLYKMPGKTDEEQPVKPVTYSVIKHGLIGLSKYLATYYADKGIRSNALALGGVYNNHPDEFVKKLANLTPLGRMAKPDEYKAAILYLSSDASSFMTGSTISIDGGRTCW
ncbi:MAG: oxidoreductase [Candidatus Taylorbacteria bacterium RIFCSPLOWO2_02_FULL_46_40]|uniref:Oxidoreductase n=1 Tax=Candidatus Taylorbacteria bacterium RIFCSPLOWO2_02_FULL_46_40 TaxID=1802329 RepID=A0A1G2P172_9BACT|nr:MAG: oxidoreductase [Candidatus Taylorbacteria bacterium RIFCSPLOWO2_02_FULL_46_40]